MAIVYFGKTVKYKGITYLPNTKFEVEDKDIDGLKLQGAWIVEMPKEEEKSEIDILRDKALELGIDFKGNWGVKKLTEAIAEAEQA